ncbi:MAG: hypothetical protein DRQ55_08785 [Planctomycetota bacterium]|nr:MAG: hypothetical protein DRQ55_08785 [Planctomycetota bacterium]
MRILNCGRSRHVVTLSVLLLALAPGALRAQASHMSWDTNPGGASEHAADTTPLSATAHKRPFQAIPLGDWYPLGQPNGAVDMADGLALVGAPAAADNVGAVFVMRWDGQTWVKEQELFAPDGLAGSYFGQSVALAHELAFAGAPRDEQVGPFSGSVAVFRRVAGTWSEEQALVPADGAAYDQFGACVSASGERVLVGAPFDGDPGTSSGSAYVFQWNGSTWVEQQKLLPPDGVVESGFGSAVALAGDFAFVGDLALVGDIGIGPLAHAFDLCVLSYGVGCAGSTPAAPELWGNGVPEPGGWVEIELRGGASDATGLLLIGWGAANLPMAGGCSLLVSPPLVTVPVSLDAGGVYRLSASIPAHWGQVLASIQVLVADPTTAGGFASSNGVLLPIEP